MVIMTSHILVLIGKLGLRGRDSLKIA